MMSVYKLPIALGLFFQVERGMGSLKKRLTVGPSDIRLGQSPIADQYPNGGITVTVDTLLHGMLVQSDNTASDLILGAIGGPETVSKRMADLGTKDVRVDRSEGQIALDYNGVTNAPPPTQWTRTLLRSLVEAVPEDRRRAAARAWVEDPRDTATPDAMADLLALAFRGKAANAEHTALLLRLMRATETGARRLKGDLPPDAVLAHRSGTSATVDGFTGAVNDVGILAMPDGSHVAIAVFLKGVTSPIPTAEESIAQIGRAVRERWPASAP
jgi:beta-lactamase class A